MPDANRPPDPSRLCLHTMTLKPRTLEQTIAACTRSGIPAISPWVEHVEPVGVATAAAMLRDAGLRVPAYVRAGFFVHEDASSRTEAVDRARRLLDDGATLGAESLVIVPGAHPAIAHDTARSMVSDALAALVDHAAGVGVRLALEPLHPMFGADRACVTTLTQARLICETIDHPALGVAVDVYHVWWDERLADEIATLGRQGRLAGFHVSDWITPSGDVLTCRALMGAGCIPIRAIRALMDDAGFGGAIEVEILSDRLWQRDQDELLAEIATAWRLHA